MAVGAWIPLLALCAPAASGEPLSSRIASYAIEAQLDADTHTVRGRQKLVWRNDTRVAAPDLHFHLYLNAFANNRTTFLRELVAASGPGVLDEWRDGWGAIALDGVRVAGEDLTARVEPIHPDDPNPDDRTVVRLPLPAPVPPGGQVEVEMEFTARLPKLLARTGYSGSFHFVAQWFPKLGVFRDGVWNCHQFHANSEFFADFGVYDVSLTTPDDYAVGATGVLREERENPDGTRTRRFVAEDVHDFAWTADPELRTQRREVEGLDVLLLCHEADCRSAERFFDSLAHAVRWFGEHIGPYPYPSFTIVVPPPFAGAAGGMEYPTLITALSPRWIPAFVRLPELVTVHEFGHQYWYGMVASNEFEEAWLDEGINSWCEGEIMSAAYGEREGLLDLPSLKIGSTAARRGAFMRAGGRDPATLPSWEFLDRRSYVGVSYDKTALALDSLAGYVGHDTVVDGLRRYFERWRFRQPRGGDFTSAMTDSAGFDLAWFFDQTLASSATVDYAVTRVSSQPAAAFAGIDVPPQPAPPADTYLSTVVIERLGEARLPVGVEVVFDDGAETHEKWDGQARWRRFEYRGTQRVSHAEVDPDDALPLDVDPLNDSRMRDPGTRGLVRLGLRWGFWFQNLLHLLTSF